MPPLPVAIPTFALVALLVESPTIRLQDLDPERTVTGHEAHFTLQAPLDTALVSIRVTAAGAVDPSELPLSTNRARDWPQDRGPPASTATVQFVPRSTGLRGACD